MKTILEFLSSSSQFQIPNNWYHPNIDTKDSSQFIWNWKIFSPNGIYLKPINSIWTLSITIHILNFKILRSLIVKKKKKKAILKNLIISTDL